MKIIKKQHKNNNIQKESDYLYKTSGNATKNCDMMDQFEVGLVKDKLKRLKLRKSLNLANCLLNKILIMFS